MLARLGLICAGRAIQVGRGVGVLLVAGVTAMRAVHEEVATDEKREERPVADCAYRYFEDEDRR